MNAPTPHLSRPRVVAPSASPILRAAILMAITLAAASAGPRSVRAQSPLPPQAYREVAVWPSRPQARRAGEFSAIAGIAVDGDRVYAADPEEEHVEVLDAEGRPRQRIATGGTGLGQLRQPRDVAVAQGRVYVADTGNGRVQVFDAVTGGFLAVWSGLDRPTAVVAAPDASVIWVAEARRGQLLRFDRAGVRREVWGRGTPTAPDLVEPVGLALGLEGDLFVADRGAAIVRRLDAAGRQLAAYELPEEPPDGAPLDVAVAPSGEIFATDRGGLYVLRDGQFGEPNVDQISRRVGYQSVAIGPGEGLTASIVDAWSVDAGLVNFPRRGVWANPLRWTSVPAPVGLLAGPRRVAARADGGAYLGDGWPRVQAWGPGGVPGGQFRSDGLVDLAAGPEDLVAVASGDRLEVRRAGGELVGSHGWDEAGSWIAAVARDGGDLVALDLGLGQLHRFPDGWGSGAAGSPVTIDAGPGLPVDMAAGGGRVLLADRESQVLRLQDAAGAEINQWPAPGRVTRVAGPGDGQVWFALTDDGWVWKYDAAGRLLAAWEAVPAGRPIDLDVNSAGGVLVVDGLSGRVHVFAPDPSGAAVPPPAAGDRCDLAPDKRAAPEVVRSGSPVTVTLSVDGDCPSESLPLDVVLVVDRSGSMQGPKIEAARNVGAAFVAELDFRKARAATVLFGNEAELSQGLTDDARAVIRGVAAARAGGGTHIAEALKLAGEELRGPRAQPDSRKAVILLTDGKPEGGFNPRQWALDEAEALRVAGVAVHAIGLGADVDASLLEAIAGDGGRYYQAPSAAELAEVYRRIARRLLTDRLLAQIDVEDEIPANFDLVPGSMAPPAAVQGRVLRWRLTDVPAEGVRLRYQLLPQQSGIWPTNVRAGASYTDGMGFRGALTFPVPRVEVLGRLAVYLPFLLQRGCPKQSSDVLLLIDTSTSMDESASPGGPTKHQASLAAARNFLTFLALPADRAAVIGFNERATVVADFTGDRSALTDALGRLPRGSGTRIDLGLAAAAERFADPRRGRDHVPVLILLTDGRSSSGTEADVRARAGGLREGGISVFTIGLGADVDGGLLLDMAGDPTRYSYAPDQTALAGIYQLLAWSLPCR